MARAAWEVVGVFKWKRTPEGAETRTAHIQSHSGLCSEGLCSSMGSGLIFPSVCGVWGWGEERRGANVCGPL